MSPTSTLQRGQQTTSQHDYNSDWSSSNYSQQQQQQQMAVSAGWDAAGEGDWGGGAGAITSRLSGTGSDWYHCPAGSSAFGGASATVSPQDMSEDEALARVLQVRNVVLPQAWFSSTSLLTTDDFCP